MWKFWLSPPPPLFFHSYFYLFAILIECWPVSPFWWYIKINFGAENSGPHALSLSHCRWSFAFTVKNDLHGGECVVITPQSPFSLMGEMKGLTKPLSHISWPKASQGPSVKIITMGARHTTLQILSWDSLILKLPRKKITTFLCCDCYGWALEGEYDRIR